MADHFDDYVRDILASEGGYVNNPADRGGPTNFGITQATLSKFLQRVATIDDVKNLDINVAREIYELRYFQAPRINKLPQPIQHFVFDCAVNHGPRRAVRFVQNVCNEFGYGPIAADGFMGPKTQAVAAECYEKQDTWMLLALIEERQMFYSLIVENDERQGIFLDGWLNRTKRFIPTQFA